MPEYPRAKGIDQRVPLIAIIEVDVSSHIGDPQAIAIMGDSTHHPAEKPFHQGGFQGTEAKGVGQQDRSRSHCENIPNDSTHPGRGSLERLDGAGMIVRLDLEGNPPSFAHVDHPRILFPSLDEHLSDGVLVGLLRREKAQQTTGILIGAVLRPHDGKNPQFSQVGHTAENPEHVLVLLRKQTVLGNELGGYLHVQTGIGVGRKSGDNLFAHDDATSTGSLLTKGSRKASSTGRPSRLG